MSTYAHLACTSCKEIIFIKDTDTPVHADPVYLGMFLEKHRTHPLVFLHEDDELKAQDGFICPSEIWPRFIDHLICPTLKPRQPTA
jgi:hypothetical protein